MLVESYAAQAMAAWGRVREDAVAISRVEVLKARKERKVVCRLAGAGPAGTDIVAKRCRLATGRLELAVYDGVLPWLGVPALRCHGIVEEESEDRCWLFLDAAAGDRYSPAVCEHRQIAGVWLGLLHSSVPARAAGSPPDRSIRHQRDLLAQARLNIASHDGNPALSSDSVRVVAAVAARLAWIEARWPALERLSTTMPGVFVHGDFVPKNLRVRHDAAGPVLLCFDWGCAGWGLPAVDLAQAPTGCATFAAAPDLAAYARVVQQRWPACDIATVQRWAAVGALFRGLAALAWSSRSLAGEWANGRVAGMRVALAALESATEIVEEAC